MLQGRIYSYLDTQLNRHGGPNFEQLPINRPHVPVHNNNRDGAGQNFIHLNTAAYSPNTLNSGSPKQATQKVGNGFFTAPSRSSSGNLIRKVSSTFADAWTQPRLFYNSLQPVEQQFLINAIRFEVSHLQSAVVKSNVLIQLNRVSNDIAKRVAEVIGLPAPAPDTTFYHDNSTAFVSIFNNELPTIATLSVAILASVKSNSSLSQAASIASELKKSGVTANIIGETLAPGISSTYSSADASAFDGIIVATDCEKLFTDGASSTFFPANRPLQILVDGYRWGKPVGALGSSTGAIKLASANTKSGVFSFEGSDVPAFVKTFEGGLKTFKFTDRFPVDL